MFWPKTGHAEKNYICQKSFKVTTIKTIFFNHRVENVPDFNFRNLVTLLQGPREWPEDLLRFCGA